MARARGRAGRGSRVGTLLFVLGGLTVLGVTFAAGALVDRYWMTKSPARPLGAGDIRAAEGRGPAPVGRAAAPEGRAAAPVGRAAAPESREPAQRKGARSRERTPVVESPPKLTFYEELIAPLEPTPLPPRPVKSARTDRSEKSARPGTGVGVDAKVKPGEDKVERVERSTAGPARFTVQLGAFRSRPQAEAMSASLSGAGHDAYVSPIDGPDGPRYRVRVGSFVTREEARRAAARLETTRLGSTYVTVR